MLAYTLLVSPALEYFDYRENEGGRGDFFAGGAADDRFAGAWHWQAGAASLTEGVLATCVSLWPIGSFRHHHNRLRPLARRMAPAAYGAFIVHPPVLVGLALAIQQVPVPAELKLACVLAGGVAGSFGLRRACRPRRLDRSDHRRGPRSPPALPRTARSLQAGP